MQSYPPNATIFLRIQHAAEGATLFHPTRYANTEGSEGHCILGYVKSSMPRFQSPSPFVCLCEDELYLTDPLANSDGEFDS